MNQTRPAQLPQGVARTGAAGLRLGLIGCGYVAQAVYAPLLARMAGELQVVALCDLNHDTAERLHTTGLPQTRVYTEINRLLEREDLSAVLVLTSDKASASVARQVLAHGVSVYLEKPPATTLSELNGLMTAEAASTACVYTAFNRRHTPLFQSLPVSPERLTRITGRLSRRDRPVDSFPFTGAHLLDSAQYFGQSVFARFQVNFQRNSFSRWHLHAELKSGTPCDLTFVPDGDCQEEILNLETRDDVWELRFPDPAAPEREVRLIHQRRGAADSEVSIDHANDPLERTGYAPCLRHFSDVLRRGDLRNSGHRLSMCVQTIAALEAMCQANTAAV